MAFPRDAVDSGWSLGPPRARTERSQAPGPALVAPVAVLLAPVAALHTPAAVLDASATEAHSPKTAALAPSVALPAIVAALLASSLELPGLSAPEGPRTARSLSAGQGSSSVAAQGSRAASKDDGGQPASPVTKLPPWASRHLEASHAASIEPIVRPPGVI